jgi:protein SCO1/2
LIIGLIGVGLGAIIGLMTLVGGQSDRPAVVGATQSTGEAKIGGPFVLVDQDGKARSEKDFFGKHTLVFFGFLYCPDICPATLQVITDTMNRLGAKQERITPVFISVDPERDTPEALKTYLGNFSPRLVGLTGTPDQVQKAAKAYRAYYKKVPNKDLPGSYTVDHSTILYLMGPDGRYITHFTHGTSPADMAKRLQAIL